MDPRNAIAILPPQSSERDRLRPLAQLQAHRLWNHQMQWITVVRPNQRTFKLGLYRCRRRGDTVGFTNITPFPISTRTSALIPQPSLSREDESQQRATTCVRHNVGTPAVYPKLCHNNSAQPAALVDVATGMFSTLAGKDDDLSEEDLDAAMTHPELTLDQSAALVTRRQLRTDIEACFPR